MSFSPSMNFWYLPRSLRSATSSALTGPLPSAAEISVSSPILTLTTAVVSTSSLLPVLGALLDLDVEVAHVEEFRHGAEHAARQQLERRVRRLVGIADRLALLDLVEQAGDALVVLVDLEPDALELGQHVGAAGLVGDQKLAAVADRLGRDMLVGGGVLDDRRGVDAGLGGEGALADVGRVAVRRAVEPLVERVRDVERGFSACRPRRRSRTLSANSGFNFSVGMIETRLALPQRSPRPLSVPWIWRAPARTAANEFATACSVSLWAWMPTMVAGNDS